MRLDDFNRYTHQQRAVLVRSRGTFLAARIEEDYLTHLYYMGNFFAEIWSHDTDVQKEFVIAFEGEFLLEPYLEMVDLSEITN
ncbi:MAG: hypothetical protein M3Q05_02760 [Bacteroidota bacterium]|nr:hypothetical protein [Bacteroidota bacterium]